MNSIQKVKIGDFGDIITGKTPSSKNPEDFGPDIMFITPPDFRNHKYLHRSDRRLSIDGKNKLLSKLLPAKSIMVTCIGEIGNIALNKGEAITNQQINSIIVNAEMFDIDYLYYVLIQSKKYLNNNAGQTVVPILSKTEFEKIKLPIHKNKDVQKNIGLVLSSIDSKIDINNIINAEIESMAKTIYDYWFVQFDFPDKNGNPYKSSGGKMVWNEKLKRKIPERWEVNKLVEIESNIVTGKTPPTKNNDFYNGAIPFVTIGDIRGNMHIINAETTLTKAGADYQKNKYLPKGSLCVSCIASPGMIGLTTQECQTNQQINSIIFKENKNKIYLYHALNNYFNFSAGPKMGNTFANMNKGDFESILLIHPPTDIIKKFEEYLDSTFEQNKLLSFENKKLSELRDFLLPMLMNGQVTVS
jgi:type I restriction enzyme, S subunit